MTSAGNKTLLITGGLLSDGVTGIAGVDGALAQPALRNTRNKANRIVDFIV